MANLSGDIGELRMVIEITRKETGKVETVELTSTITDPQTHETLLKEYGNGCDTLDGK